MKYRLAVRLSTPMLSRPMLSSLILAGPEAGPGGGGRSGGGFSGGCSEGTPGTGWSSRLGRIARLMAGGGVDHPAVLKVLVGGVSGDPGLGLGAVITQEDRVAIDVLGQGSVAGDHRTVKQLVSVHGRIRSRVNGGVQGKPPGLMAKINDGAGGSLLGLFAAEDVLEGVGAKAVAPEVFLIVGFEVEGAVFLLIDVAAGRARGWRGGSLCLARVGAIAARERGRPAVVPMPLAVNAPVENAVGVIEQSAGIVIVFRFSFGIRVRGWVVKAATQEFPGGGQAVVGFEVVEVALHHVHQETDGGAAVVGLFANQGGEVLVEGSGDNILCRRRGSWPPGGGGMGSDEGMGRGPAEVEELTGGVEAVAGLGVFQVALHEVYEEADDEAAVVGFLADDVGEGGGFLVGLRWGV